MPLATKEQEPCNFQTLSEEFKALAKAFKFFLCSCRRCADPRELGSNLGTRLCGSCRGDLLPVDPLDLSSSWVCQKCGKSLIASIIAVDEQQLTMEYRSLNQKSAKQLEDFIVQIQQDFHPNHAFIMEAKETLVKLWGNHPNYKYRDMTMQQLEKKISYCRELLAIADAVNPGLSQMRGTLLFELQAGLLASIKMMISNDAITTEAAQIIMAEAMKHLEEASLILKHEPEMESGGLDAKLNKLSQEIDV